MWPRRAFLCGAYVASVGVERREVHCRYFVAIDVAFSSAAMSLAKRVKSAKFFARGGPGERHVCRSIVGASSRLSRGRPPGNKPSEIFRSMCRRVRNPAARHRHPHR